IFYKLLYTQLAWSYNLVASLVSVGQWNEWVESVLPFLGNGKILELGHGPGHLQSLAFDQQLDITGLDLSPQMGKICRKRLLDEQHHPKLVTASGIKIPFTSGCFSTIVSTFPADYIIKQETLSEIYRMLNQEGKFILLPIAWITGKSFLHRLAAILFQITGQSPSRTASEFEAGIKIFRSAGFDLETHQIALKHSRVLILEATKL
ncbi:MAG: class I SAM-dependent methyltransferase, partial [Chloroflexota bacterium]